MFQIIAASIIIPYSTSTSSVDQTYEGFIECILLNCIGNFMHSVSIILEGIQEKQLEFVEQKRNSIRYNIHF